MVKDRRTKRAHAPLLALEYFLDAEREKVGASAIGLFLDDEPLVVSAADAFSQRALASCVGDRASRERAMAADRSGGEPTDRDLYVLPMAEGELVLASLDARVRSVREMERSITRILSAAA